MTIHERLEQLAKRIETIERTISARNDEMLMRYDESLYRLTAVDIDDTVNDNPDDSCDMHESDGYKLA